MERVGRKNKTKYLGNSMRIGIYKEKIKKTAPCQWCGEMMVKHGSQKYHPWCASKIYEEHQRTSARYSEIIKNRKSI